SSADRLSPDQAAAFADMGGAPPGGRGRGRGGQPNYSQSQIAALAQMSTDLRQATQSLATARSAVVSASLSARRDDAAIQSKVDAVAAAELALAKARADAFAKLQASPARLAPEQATALAAAGGAFPGGGGRGAGGGGNFTEPEPINFND